MATGINGEKFHALKYLVVKLDPTNQQKKDAKKKADRLLERLSIQNLKSSLNEYELSIAAQLIDPSSIDVTWRDVAGSENIIDDITSTVILPIRNPELFKKSNLHQPSKGVILHGPPGWLLKLILLNESLDYNVDLDRIAELTDEFSGSDLRELCRASSLARVKEYVQNCPISSEQINRETASDSKKATSKSGLTIQANSDCRANSSSSSTSSIDNYSLMSGNGHQPFNASTPLRPMKMEDFLTVIHKMLESKRHLGSGNGHSVIGLD